MDKPWTRKEVIGDCTLYQGDCMEVMPVLGRFDAVVTDPPYGVKQAKGFSGAEGFSGAKGFSKPVKRREYKGDWDDARPSSELFQILRGIASIQIIWGGQYFADILPPQGKWLWWDKCQTMPSYGDGELAWTNLSGSAPKRIIYNNNGLQAKEKGRVHPTQKPVAVMLWCLGLLPDAQTILDPFMGSGTTGVACAKTGRKFTGIEQDPDYFQIACERIHAAYQQTDMFVDAPDEVALPQQATLEGL